MVVGEYRWGKHYWTICPSSLSAKLAIRQRLLLWPHRYENCVMNIACGWVRPVWEADGGCLWLLCGKRGGILLLRTKGWKELLHRWVLVALESMVWAGGWFGVVDSYRAAASKGVSFRLGYCDGDMVCWDGNVAPFKAGELTHPQKPIKSHSECSPQHSLFANSIGGPT